MISIFSHSFHSHKKDRKLTFRVVNTYFFTQKWQKTKIFSRNLNIVLLHFPLSRPRNDFFLSKIKLSQYQIIDWIESDRFILRMQKKMWCDHWSRTLNWGAVIARIFFQTQIIFWEWRSWKYKAEGYGKRRVKKYNNISSWQLFCVGKSHIDFNNPVCIYLETLVIKIDETTLVLLIRSWILCRCLV